MTDDTAAPPASPLKAPGVPMPEGKLWSLLRSTAGDGASIETHNGTMSYEHISALLDARAAARVKELVQLVEAYAAAREAAAVERVVGVLRELVEVLEYGNPDALNAAEASARAVLANANGGAK